MPFTLTMPKLSPTMEAGVIVKWHKKIGDLVKADELLFEVATDKATVEYNALDEGWLRKVIVFEGKEANVNQPVAIFSEQKEETIEGYIPLGLASEPPSEQQSKAQVKSSQSSPLSLSKNQEIYLKQTDVFAPELALKTSSNLTELHQKHRLKASPLAKKLAEKEGLDLSSVKGTGPGNRIVSRDLANVRARKSDDFEGRRELPGSYVEEDLSPMRKVIAKRLQEAKSSIPHFYVSQKINAQPLVDIREQLKNHIKLTYNDFIVRGCALALRKHPYVNSGFNSGNNCLIRFKTVDICVAVSVSGGLITPIVRYADFKSIAEISLEIKDLASRAKEGKLKPQEYQGGSFTISNLGMYGISDFTAIINPPQGAILAVSGIQEIPVVREGRIIPGKEMTLTLSADHRVIDGAAAASFLKTIQTYLENPASVLI